MAEQASYLKNLKSESVVQKVINCLTDGMVSGELKPGDKLPTEPELAATLGVARTSVREATKILTYLGVLESRRSEGTFVANGFQESMIDPMVYGIILNKGEDFDSLMELRELDIDSPDVALVNVCSDNSDMLSGFAKVLKRPSDTCRELEYQLGEEIRSLFARNAALRIENSTFSKTSLSSFPLTPQALAASINSWPRREMTEERTIRANCGIRQILIAISTFTSPGPRAPTIATARIVPGRAKNTSMILIKTISTLPP